MHKGDVLRVCSLHQPCSPHACRGTLDGHKSVCLVCACVCVCLSPQGLLSYMYGAWQTSQSLVDAYPSAAPLPPDVYQFAQSSAVTITRLALGVDSWPVQETSAVSGPCWRAVRAHTHPRTPTHAHILIVLHMSRALCTVRLQVCVCVCLCVCVDTPQDTLPQTRPFILSYLPPSSASASQMATLNQIKVTLEHTHTHTECLNNTLPCCSTNA